MTQLTTKFSDLWHGSMLAALTACMAVGLAGVARAAPASDAAPSVRVPYGDLNLTSVEGANTLNRRITAAAHQVCSADGVDGRDLQAFTALRSCEARAIADAEQQVHALAAR